MRTRGAVTIESVRIDDVSDLDWYIDHVVVPSGPQLRQVGPARAWQAWWDALARRLAAAAGADPKGDAVRLALTQGFVLTRADTRRCGVPDAETRRLVRRGQWPCVDHGCLAVAATAGDDPWLSGRRAHALRAAAAAVKRADHVVAATSAVIMHGLPVLDLPDRPELVAGSGATFGRLERAHVRRRILDARDAQLWFGTRVMSAACAVVDTARDALSLASVLIESPLESLTHLAVHDSRLPPPELQQWVTGADGRRYRVDFLWPALRLALEAEGWLRELIRTRQSW